jgi:mono/diheme cytochrome c family protein
MIRYIAIALFLGSFALWAGITASTFLRQRPVLPESVTALARGRAGYQVNCQTCHGETGHGDGLVAKLGVPGVADLHSVEARALSEEAIFQIITHGKGKMEGYGQSIPEQERHDIAAYVKSLQTP